MARQGYDMHGRVALERESWRDVAAAYVVHKGLQLASVVGRRAILDVLTRERCAFAREQSATTARPSK